MHTAIQAALLGIVQGLTEFLPVSSSAHLILARMFLGFDSEQFGLPFDVAVHFGTLLAVVAYFQGDVLLMIRALPFLFRSVRSHAAAPPAVGHPNMRGESDGARLVWLVAVGTIPAVIVGVLFGDLIERDLRTPAVAAMTLGLGGIALIAAERFGSKRRTEQSLTMAEAFWIGCAQAAALVPGVSRAGATITVAMLFGLGRPEAARFTFLLGIVAILGAAVREFPDMLAQGLGGSGALLFAIGIVSSAITGYLAVKYFLRFVVGHSLDPFAWYRLVLAAIVVVWLAAA
jgi:undecaprenyl-diphosphatase